MPACTGPRRPPPAGAPLPLGARDRELLAFAAEQRFVLAAQLARRLGVTARTAGRRVAALRAAGLLRAERPFAHETPAYRITRAGLRAIASPRPLPRPIDPALYRHDVGVTWLAAAAAGGGFGELREINGERRMRSEDGRRGAGAPEPAHGVRIGAGEARHFPDLVLVTAAGHRIAVELELTTKEPARRERILAAYAAEPRIDAVLYLVEHPAAAAALARSAARAGAAGKLRVQRFRWADRRAPGAPAPGRERTGARRGAPRTGQPRAAGR
jgi:DNA-binding transcriptional ArsR family regulator